MSTFKLAHYLFSQRVKRFGSEGNVITGQRSRFSLNAHVSNCSSSSLEKRSLFFSKNCIRGTKSGDTDIQQHRLEDFPLYESSLFKAFCTTSHLYLNLRATENGNLSSN
ncbi:hypothetical protein H6F98_32415 [Microcoleus sp. FACHB-SPT15]|uniref:hypothetical protein n=1 Tax=Microcoleus sp. FACHB-SPT15 TaxID=2692830 RepID=UPI00177AF308|nr:hypothetical protein [Microcoleus sp. FACHB-SPT15]MBD1810118.1 hypothetical protein [Microcoleus sp. FACHB-SPT15]